ncbi:MAG: hypothetical protein ACLT33_10520 [Lachnospira pectinoschiza]
MKSHWWRLKAKEKEAYLKIISGEEDISYFDTFVKNGMNRASDYYIRSQ